MKTFLLLDSYNTEHYGEQMKTMNFLPKGSFLDPSYSKCNKICICKRIGLALLYVHYKC